MSRLHFLAAAQQGQNHGWRYCLGIAIILGTWIVGSSAAAIAILFAGQLGLVSPPAYQALIETGRTTEVSLTIFIITDLIFVSALLALWLIVSQLHGRSLRSLIRAQPPIRWRRAALGFGLWFLLLNLMTGLDYELNPDAYDFNFNLAQWLPFTAVALVLTPIQTSAEELFFRGYLLQGFGLVTRSRYLPIALSSLCFLLPHLGNPEMGRHGGLVALTYLTLALFLAFITVADNGLELALGVHAANNLSVVVIANTRDSALPSPAIWLSDSGDPLGGLLALGLISAIFYWLAIARSRCPLD